LGIPGGNHNGVNLSDTNIVASIDPINNKAAMLSLPRDMWVDNPSTGGSSKLNAIHAYGETQEEGYGPTASKKAVSEILNIPIHYYIRIDFKGVEKLIDALGGVEVEVENDIYDPYFPDQYGSGYSPYSIEEGVHHLNGVEALKYARSRYTTSDFDRAARQQQILMAAKEQLSAKNLFTQPQKILDIIGIAKHHLRTDLNTDEIKRLMSIVEQINTDEVVSKVLDNSPTGLLVSDNINGASVLLPKDGDFRQIQALAHRIFVEPYLKQEAAKIEIRNGTTIAGLAGQTKEILESYGYTVSKIDDAKRKDYERTFIIDYSGGSKPHSLDLLKKRIGVGELMSDGFVKTEADILIVLGSNFSIDELYR
jgi:LCP family protein required for cell wall assembly